jgi:PAS domain-containing protein
MLDVTARTDDMLHSALKAVAHGEAALHAALEALPAPIYTTDRDGLVTFFNAGCIDFTGRRPEVGKDRWCVTWKLYTDAGVFLPHDQCPMAVALKSGRPVRGVSAIAERPDGTRVNFLPFPTPIFNESGALIGAANLLLDVTEARQIADLRKQAQRARRLAAGASDPTTIGALKSMAEEYDAKAAELETRLN